MRGLAAGIAAALVLSAGCQQLTDTFRCGTAATCGAGTCEPTGYCSFDDTSCASGRRYGAASSEELANTCVADTPVDDAARPDGSPPPLDVALPSRVTRGLAALYTFAPGLGGGTSVPDVSGFGDPLNLTIPAGVEVVDGEAIFDGGDDALSSTATASKIVTACEISDEATIEAWVRPASELSTGGQHQISGLMLDFQTRDIALLEDDGVYKADLRSDATIGGASGTMTSPSGLLATRPTHVVSSRVAGGDRVLYVDGEIVLGLRQAGALDPWSNYRLFVGNNPDGSAPYAGKVHLVAYYCSGLSSGEVMTNYLAGPDAGD